MLSYLPDGHMGSRVDRCYREKLINAVTRSSPTIAEACVTSVEALDVSDFFSDNFLAGSFCSLRNPPLLILVNAIAAGQWMFLFVCLLL